MEAFALLWVREGGCQQAAGKCRQIHVMADKGGGALLDYLHLPKEQEQLHQQSVLCFMLQKKDGHNAE